MIKGRKNILIICPFARPNIGGVETHIDKLISYATSKDYYVTLLTYQPLTTSDRGLGVELGDYYEIHRVSWFGRGWFPKIEKYFPLVFLYLFPGLFVKSFLYYRRHKQDIECIHAHGLVAALITKSITFLVGEKRSVVSTHAVYRLTSRKLLARLFKWVLSGFDKILAVSEVSRNELIEIGLNAEKIGIHPNWVSTEMFKPTSDSESEFLPKPPQKFNLLFLGRLIDIKGIKLYLDAVKELPEIGFHIVGNGPMEEDVKKQAAIYKNIYFYGTLKQADPEDFKKILNLYRLCNYLVSPYLYDEGFSAVLIEALACGTKVIVPRRGSPPTFLNEDVAIFLSHTPVSAELVELFKKLRQENIPKSSYIDICRDFALENFGPKNADVIIKSYE